jgi:hypothetical protein
MSTNLVGKTYLWLLEQEPELWTHELGEVLEIIKDIVLKII